MPNYGIESHCFHFKLEVDGTGSVVIFLQNLHNTTGQATSEQLFKLQFLKWNFWTSWFKYFSNSCITRFLLRKNFLIQNIYIFLYIYICIINMHKNSNTSWSLSLFLQLSVANVSPTILLNGSPWVTMACGVTTVSQLLFMHQVHLQ